MTRYTPKNIPVTPAILDPYAGTQTASAPSNLIDTTQMPPSQITPASPGLQSLVEEARKDLAQRLSISASQINLVEAKEVVWPNSSLGCPQPGMVYAEVLTPGYLIVLNAGDKDYEYHASRGTEVVFCENPSPPVPGAPEDT